MRSPAILLSAGALLISACANQYVLNVDTVPTGATVQVAGELRAAFAPAQVFYEPDPKFRDPTTKCWMARGIRATWQSGATVASLDPLALCGKFNTWTLTLSRPSGYPGLETDLMVERRILYERQLRAERGAAAMAAGFQSLGYGLGCLAGGGCSSSGTSYSYSPPARATKTAPSYQGGDRDVYKPPVPDLNLDLRLPLGSPKPDPRCRMPSANYTSICR